MASYNAETGAITTRRGDYFDGTFTMTPMPSGTPVGAHFSAKKKFTDTEYALQKSLGDGITYQGDGVFYLEVFNADTENLSAATYKYDFEFDMGDGKVFTPIVGNLIIEDDVTRVS